MGFKKGYIKGQKTGGIKKGQKQRKTQIKEALGIEKTGAILKKLDENIEEFINSSDKNTRLDATKAFLNYYKPRKLEHSGTFTGNINITFKY